MGRGSQAFTIGTIGRKALVAALLAATALPASITVIDAKAIAQSSVQASFNIPAGPLSRSLASFGSQSGTQVSYDASIAAGKTSTGFQGAATREQALARILQGSGLTYSFTDPTNVLITDRVAAAHDTPPPATDGSLVLDTITISSGAGGNPADVPYETAGSSTYISGEQIERFRGNSPGDIFRGTPGVLSGDNRSSGALDPNIRGMQGMNRVPILIDGSQQSTQVYRGYSGVNTRTYVDPDLIGGISVEKGPSSRAAGMGAIGGLVSMRTLVADDILEGGASFGARMRASANTNTASPPPIGTKGGIQYGEQYGYPSPFVPPYEPGTGLDRPAFLSPTGGSGSIAVAAKQDRFELLGAYARREMGNYFAGSQGKKPRIVQDGNRYDIDGISTYRLGEEVLNTSIESESVLLKGKVHIADDHILEGNYLYYDSHFGEILPSQMWGNAEQQQLSHVTVNTFTTKYNFDSSDTDLINLSINAWHTDLKNQTNNSGAEGILAQSETGMTGVDISNTSELSNRFGDTKFTIGASYIFEDTSPFGPPIGYTPRDGTRREYGILTGVDYQPTDWLRLEGNLRYQNYRTFDRSREITGIIYNPDGSYTNVYGPHLRRSGDGFSPSLAATLMPIDGLQVWAKYAEGLRLPSLAESSMMFSTLPQRNLDLTPERAKATELGANYIANDIFSAGDRIQLKVSYFNTVTDDYISRVVTAIPSYALYFENIRSATFRGFEGAINYDSDRFFGSIGATYYTDVEFCYYDGNCSGGTNGTDFSTNHIPPKFAASMTVGGRFLDDTLTVGGRISYTGKRATEQHQAGTIVLVKWDPYTLVDLFMTYKINENFVLDVTAENVFDQYYVDPLSVTANPGPGRSIRASLTTKF